MSRRPEHLADQPDLHAQDSDAVLGNVLRWLHISGALFLRAEFSAPWAYESPPAEALAAALKPGARRLILFHIVPEGSCSLSLADGTSVQLEAGDCVMLPYAHQHRVGSAADAETVPIGKLLPMPPWDTMPVIRHGGGGALTQIVCGYLHSDELLFNPVLGALPRLMHLRPGGTPLAPWIEASFRYALHASELRRPTDDVLLQRLPELLFVECLRQYLRDRGQEPEGWFAALADPVVGRALALMHADHAQAWTLDTLAHAAATSRSRLDERFRRHLGCAPMQYLAKWRLQVAGQMLRTTQRGVADIADSVGYGSEASLSRAFKRHTGVSPALWRRGACPSA
jgi:AraC-like DNA-binding protein